LRTGRGELVPALRCPRIAARRFAGGGQTTSRRRHEAMAKIKPINDKVLVKRLEAEGKTKGGIILPDNAKEKPREGRVVAVGNGKVLKNGERSKFQVKTGDRIIFSSYAGTEVKLDGEEFLILGEDDVLAVVEN
jgi:chaperonin GroES